MMDPFDAALAPQDPFDAATLHKRRQAGLLERVESAAEAVGRGLQMAGRVAYNVVADRPGSVTQPVSGPTPRARATDELGFPIGWGGTRVDTAAPQRPTPVQKKRQARARQSMSAMTPEQRVAAGYAQTIGSRDPAAQPTQIRPMTARESAANRAATRDWELAQMARTQGKAAALKEQGKGWLAGVEDLSRNVPVLGDLNQMVQHAAIAAATQGPLAIPQVVGKLTAPWALGAEAAMERALPGWLPLPVRTTLMQTVRHTPESAAAMSQFEQAASGTPNPVEAVKGAAMGPMIALPFAAAGAVAGPVLSKIAKAAVRRDLGNLFRDAEATWKAALEADAVRMEGGQPVLRAEATPAQEVAWGQYRMARYTLDRRQARAAERGVVWKEPRELRAPEAIAGRTEVAAAAGVEHPAEAQAAPEGEGLATRPTIPEPMAVTPSVTAVTPSVTKPVPVEGPGMTAEQVAAIGAAKAPEHDAYGQELAATAGGEYVPGPPKTPQRLAEKVAEHAGTGYDLLSPSDHVRGAVIVPSWVQMPDVIRRLAVDGWTIEDTLTSPSPHNESGFRGIKAVRRMPEGINAEIQLATPDLWRLKVSTDAVYAAMRRKTPADWRQDPEGYAREVKERAQSWEAYNSIAASIPVDVRSLISDSSIGTATSTMPQVISRGAGIQPSLEVQTNGPLVGEAAKILPSSSRQISGRGIAVAPIRPEYTTAGAEIHPAAAGNVSLGAQVAVRTEPGSSVEARYAVLSAEKVVASHTTDFTRNPAHPQGLQGRDRSAAALREQVERMARELDPVRLGDWPMADNGAPVVDEAGNTVAGNGRTIALQLAYRRGTGGGYRQWLVDNAERFGLEPQAVAAVEEPVLVRMGRWASEAEKVQFARDSDVSGTAMRRASEVAEADARLLDEGVLGRFVPNEESSVNTAANTDFRRAFLERVVTSPAERNAMLQPDGTFSQQGIERVRAALFQKAYGDAHLSARLTEATEDTGLNVLKAALQAAPRLARMRELIAQGALNDLDIAPEIGQAITRYSAMKERSYAVRGKTVEFQLSERGLGITEGEQMPPMVESLVRFFEANRRSPKPIRDLFERYAAAVEQRGAPEQISLTGEGLATREALLARVMQGQQKPTAEADLFTQPAAAAPAPAARPVEPTSEPPSGRGMLVRAPERISKTGGVTPGPLGRARQRVAVVSAETTPEGALAEWRRARDSAQGAQDAVAAGAALPARRRAPLKAKATRAQADLTRAEEQLKRLGMEYDPEAMTWRAGEARPAGPAPEAGGLATRPTMEERPALTGAGPPRSRLSARVRENLRRQEAERKPAPSRGGAEPARPGMEEVPPPRTDAEAPPLEATREGWGSRNTIVTRERAQAAAERIRAKLSRPGFAGISDPSIFADLAEMGVHHLEAGARQFGAWAKQMERDLEARLGDAWMPIRAEVRRNMRRIWKDSQQAWEANREPYRAVAAEIVSPKEAEKLSQPAHQLLGWWHQTVRHIWNRDVSLERARNFMREAVRESDALGPSSDPYITMALASNVSGGRFEQAMERGWRNIAGEKVAPGFKEIAERAQGGGRDLKEFSTYLEMLHVQDLLADREAAGGFRLPEAWTPDYRRETLRMLDCPEFRQASEMLQQYNHQLRLVLEEAGLMPQGWAARMAEKYPHYVPLVRIIAGGMAGEMGGLGAEVGAPQLVKPLLGGRPKVLDPLAEIQKRTRIYLEVAELWKSRRQLADWADMAGPEMAWVMRKVPEEELGRILGEPDMQRMAQRFITAMADESGAAPNLAVDTVKAALEGLGMWRGEAKGSAAENIIPVMRNGQAEFYQVHPDLLPVFAARNKFLADWAAKVLKYTGAGFFRSLKQQLTTTYSWKFNLRNLARDWPTMILQSEGFGPMVKDMAGALAAIVGRSNEYEALVRAGALQTRGEALAMDPNMLQKAWTEGARRFGRPATSAQTAAKWALFPLQMLARVAEVVESTPRVATARKTLRARRAAGMGMEDALTAAAAAAREATVPFERSGLLVKAINQVVPFFSAGFQGPYTAARAFKARPSETALKGLLYITLPALVNYAVNRDNPDWQNLPGWRKYAGLNWAVGKDAKGETRWAFVPAPWEWGVVFLAAPLAALEALKKTDPDTWKEFVEAAYTATSPLGNSATLGDSRSLADAALNAVVGGVESMLPAVVSPVLGVGANKSWTGRAIVPEHMETEKSPRLQMHEWNSELARWIGDKLNFSPAKIDYLCDEYFGTVGRDARELMNWAWEKRGKGTREVAPGDTSAWLRGMVFKASSYSDMKDSFYGQLQRLKDLSSEDALSDEEADQFDEATAVASDLSQIRKEKREIVTSEDSPTEKQQQLDELIAEETEIVAEFLGRPAPEWARAK